jgi:hypothetical protein
VTAAIDEAYGQGWHDAQQAIGRRLLSLISESQPPRPAVWQRRCQHCQQTMEIGQQAETAGQDIFGNHLYVHLICPPVVDVDQEDGDQEPNELPPLSLVKDPAPVALALAPAEPKLLDWERELLAAADARERDLLGIVRAYHAAGQDQEPPSTEGAAAPAPDMLLAVATGQLGGPFIITVTNPAQGAYQLAHIELKHWTGFGTMAAARELEAHGYRILASAVTSRETIGDGWALAAPFVYTAPVAAIEEEDQEPEHPDNYLAGLTMHDVAHDTEEMQAPLPHRVPAASLQVHPMATEPTFEPVLQYLQHDGQAVTYLVTNAVCSLDRGPLHMTMTYTQQQQLDTQRTVCQNCGSDVAL